MYEYGHHSTGMYRSRDGMIAGVCKGIADHFDWSVTWIRVGVVCAAVLLAFWPVVIGYAAAALLMKKEPYVRW